MLHQMRALSPGSYYSFSTRSFPRESRQSRVCDLFAKQKYIPHDEDDTKRSGENN